MTSAQEPRYERFAASVLPPVAASAATARHRVLPLLGWWFSPEQRDVAQLLVSELVTNAILYTEAAISFSALVSARCLHVEVGDSSSSMPTVQPPEASTGGWGLYLVNELASRWGAERREAGKCVWFELDRLGPGGVG